MDGLANLVRAEGVPVPGDHVVIAAVESDLDGLRAVVKRTWASALTVEILEGPDTGAVAAITFGEARSLPPVEGAA